MDFTVTTRGQTFDQLTRDIARGLTAAHKKAGRQVARKGKAAANKGAPHMGHSPLKASAKTEATTTSCRVSFSPVTVGGWTIWETGAGGHDIFPRNRRALKLAADFYAADVWHPGFAGRRLWTAANARIAKAVDADVVDVYDDALRGTGV